MDKEQLRHILFSARFQEVFDHLGVFSIAYVSGCKNGIDPAAFIKECGSVLPGAEPVIAFLLSHEVIIQESDGLLHLNPLKFYGMTFWDLLILVEPWVARTATASLHTMAPDLIEMCRTEKLTDAYMEVVS